MPKKDSSKTLTSRGENQYSLVTTKLYVPRLRPYVVSRPRLLDKLDEVKDRKLALVSAPAGFGKTTLLSDWINQSRISAAWLSLDSGDNDHVHFLVYMIAALQGLGKNIGQAAAMMLHTPQPPPVETVLAALINDISTLPKDFVLVLDDYHVITAGLVHQAIQFLLEHLPQNMHLVIASRSDPPLPLGRLRSLNQLAELRVTDLCFTTDETSIFFNKKLNLGLSRGEIVMLESRIEGWIAGLQLAALSIQDREDRSGFIRDFRGDNRYIFDYLMEEVLSRQPEDVQNFLLQTSILDRLSGSLCDAVTKQRNSQKMLNHLERADLFIFPLDDGRQWFRYHNLFADLLQHRLEQAQGKLVAELHRRAGEWCVSNGLKDQAVNHALASGDAEWAARLIEEIAESIWDRGQQIKLLKWFEALPDEKINSSILLSVLHARTLNISGRLEAAEKILQHAESRLKSVKEGFAIDFSPDSEHTYTLGKNEFQGRISVIRAFIAAYRGEMLRVMQHARQALVSLHEKDLMWRAVAATTLGFVHGWSGDGDLMSARYAFAEAEKVSEEAGNTYFYLFASSCHAGIDGLQGRLNQAEQAYQRLLKFAEEKGMLQTSLAGSIYAAWGGIILERNDLEEGARLIEKGLRLALLGHDVVVIASSRLHLARALAVKGDLAGAQRVIEEIEKSASEFAMPPWIQHAASAFKAEIWLASGNREAVSRWVQERNLGIDDELTNRRESEHIVLARFLLAQGKLDEAEHLLDRLIQSAEAGTRIVSLIWVILLKTLALDRKGKMDLALDELKKVLFLAEPGGFIISIVHESSRIAELLEKVLEQAESVQKGKRPEFSRSYIKKLLLAFKSTAPPKTEGIPGEPLSERELEVLHFIAAGLTNQQIARKLFVSLNTIRSHTKNIHSKLNVHSRTQAVARAKELGIL
ncbi:MAG: LuxR C-terminal-related transcriptional regulator [Candidatus Aminicenantes bacterium]|nr:LuxR C-terminal-related transcriptional regulator [Candidatus Aminicenantes bacterium]